MFFTTTLLVATMKKVDVESVDKENKTVTAVVNHFSIYKVKPFLQRELMLEVNLYHFFADTFYLFGRQCSANLCYPN